MDAGPGLGGGEDGVRRVEADDVLDLLADAFGLGGGQVDLVQDRHDLVIVVDGLVDVGERLGLDALARIHHQDRAFAGRQRPRDLVGEVHVAGRVHQVQDIGLAIVSLVGQAHGLGLDGDPALALDLHVVEHLFSHLALGERAGLLDQPVRQRGFAVVDVGDDGKIADVVERRRHVAPASSTFARLGETPARLRVHVAAATRLIGRCAQTHSI